MTYAALAFCCALLSYAASNAVVSFGAALYWRFTLRKDVWTTRAAPAPSFLFATRMLPAAASTLFVTLFFIPGFFKLEPRDTTEAVTPLMLAVASASALLLAWGGMRGLLSWLATSRLVKKWTSEGERLQTEGTPAHAYSIDSDFPVISLAGIIRPRLFLSRRVVSSCTPRQLSFVLAHEAAHRARLDNLKCLLMRSCPDFLSLTPMAESIERRWYDATEMAADDSAAGSDLGARTELAAALVKVARLAAGRSFPYNLPVSAFHQGGNIDHRVRRLVSEPGSHPKVRHHAYWACLSVGTMLLFALALEPRVLQEVHRFTEFVVDFLQ